MLLYEGLTFDCVAWYNIRKFEYVNVVVESRGRKKMDMEREEQLYRMQADLCQALADPTRLKLLSLLGERPRAVKDLVEATGERQAKISQHLAIMRQRGIVRTQRVGTEVHYSLADPRILEACHITREVLLQQLTRHANLATPLA
jgi:ArsR family transcriptional regulator, virulence genes transcriptional regulator